MTDPLFPQLHVNLVNQHLFEEIVKSEHEVCTAEQRPARRVLSKDKENVDYFANLSALKGTRLQVLWDVYHIIIMAIEGPEESQSKYTQEWVK